MTTAFLSLIYLLSLFLAVGSHIFFPEYKQIALILYLVTPGLLGLLFMKKEGITYRLFRPYLCKAQLGAWLSGWLWFLGTLALSCIWQRPQFDSLLAQVIPIAAKAHLPPALVLFGITLFTSFVSVFTIQLLFAALQEVVWRGALVNKMQSLGFWSAALVIGTLWGAWQAPAIALLGYRYPTDPLIGIAFGLLFSLALTPILLWLAIDTFHIGVAAIFYATVSSFGPLLNTLFGSGSRWIVGYGGLASIAMLVLFNGWVLLRLRQEESVIEVES